MEELKYRVVEPVELTKEVLDWMDYCMRVYGRTGLCRTQEISIEELKKQFPTDSDSQ